MPPVSRMRHLVLGEDFPAAKKGKCRQSSANSAEPDPDPDPEPECEPEPVLRQQRHRRKRAQKNPGQKLASEKKKSLDKRNGMVYNGNPYCDSMPIYAIPYYMSILTQVAAVVKREVC